MLSLTKGGDSWRLAARARRDACKAPPPRARARPRPYAERLDALAAAVHVSPPRAAAAVAAATASMASGGSGVAPELTPDVAVNF